MNNVKKLELIFQSFTRVNDGLHFFQMSSLSNTLIKEQKIKPLQVTKLSLINPSFDQGTSSERYYSLLNNPEISSSGLVDFKFLVRDNIEVKTSNCFPLRLRNLTTLDKIYLSYPFGNTSYETQGVFNYNSHFVKPKLLVLISFGTGAVPIAQLLNAIKLDENNLDSLRVLTYGCERVNENLLGACLGNSYINLNNYVGRNLSIKLHRFESLTNLVSHLDDNLALWLSKVDFVDTFFIVSGSNLAKKQLISHLQFIWKVPSSNLSCLF